VDEHPLDDGCGRWPSRRWGLLVLGSSIGGPTPLDRMSNEEYDTTCKEFELGCKLPYCCGDYT
jgi:hypothetical protein